tara:strand:+ start:1439 stop:3250 length:1812 start_codon:yes stop_codon:yes gene_type:complete
MNRKTEKRKESISKINFIGSLSKTLSVVNKRDKSKFIKLIILVFIQALLDVISLASLMPLLYIIQDKNTLSANINKYLGDFGLDLINIQDNNMLSIYIPLIVIILMIFSTLTRLYVVYRTNKFIEDIRHEISFRLMNKYIANKLEINRDTSEVAKSILSEVDQFIIIVFQPTMLMLTNIVFLIGIIIYLFCTNLSASFYSILLLGGFYFTFYVFSKKVLNIEGYKSERFNKGRFKTAIESFRNIKDIKIYKAEKYFANRFRNYSRDFANTNSIYSTLTASPKYLLEMIVFVTLAFAILLISFNKSVQLDAIPLLGTFAFAAYKSQPALSNVIYGINSLEYGSKIISNLCYELRDRESSLIDNENSNIEYISYKKEDTNFIIIDKLKYIYSKDKNNIEGVKNINLSVKKKSLFIIAGESGSGKSTLLNLIAGFIKPQGGRIIFNTSDITYDQPKISYLHQDYSLFDSTIAENIAFGIHRDRIDYENLKNVIYQAGLEEYVKKLKYNIYDNVGENGSNLSVGQRQRIALARALYFKPDLLILDEPTSALDKNNEKKIIETIINISKSITVIMSTHKMNYLPDNIMIGFINNQNGIEVKRNSQNKL